MLDTFSSFERLPLLFDFAVGSVIKWQMSTNEGFPFLLAFSDKPSSRTATFFAAHARVVTSNPCEAVLHSRWLKLSHHHHLQMSSLHLKKLPASGHTHSLHHTRHTHKPSYNKNLEALQMWQKRYNANTQPTAGADAAALVSGSSPINLSTMLEAISSLQFHPPLACPTCSVKTGQMATNEGFPVLLAFSNKACKSNCNVLPRSGGACCLRSVRSCST